MSNKPLHRQESSLTTMVIDSADIKLTIKGTEVKFSGDVHVSFRIIASEEEPKSFIFNEEPTLRIESRAITIKG